MISRSTTFRFAALVFFLQVVAAAILLFGVGALLRSQSRTDAVDLAEASRADLLTAHARGGTSALAEEITARMNRPAERSAVLCLADSQGRALAGNLSRVPLGLAESRSYTLMHLIPIGQEAPEAMFVRLTALPGGGRLVTGTVVESERQLFAQLERATLVAVGLSILFAGFAAFASTRLILNRLQATIKTLDCVREGDLARRVPGDGTSDAFALLADQVNRTLDRVEALNAQLKLATDALAHDLKSPLTRLQFALDNLSRIVDEPGAQSAVDQAISESGRLLAIVDTSLSITRAEAGLGKESFRPVDLSGLLANLVDIYAPMIEDDGRAIVLNAPSTVTMPVHRQLIEQAVGNLVDNAIKYGAGAITVTLFVRDDGAAIQVTDEGPGIPEQQRAKALARFSRLDQARRGGGAGLGLSLVQAVAHLHGGSLELNECSPGLGATLILASPNKAS